MGDLADLLLPWHPVFRAASLPHLLHEPLLVPQERLNLQHLLGGRAVELPRRRIAALICRLRLVEWVTGELSHRGLVAVLVSTEFALVQGVAGQLTRGW